MLCVKDSELKSNFVEVQKDVKIEDLLLNHTQYFDTAEEALNNGYVPLQFDISIRSSYDNTVVVSTKGVSLRNPNDPIGKNPIIVVGSPEQSNCVHKGYDLVMYMSSLGVMSCVKHKKGFEELMMKHSQFDCIGLYYGVVTYPIIYSHIILSDEGMRKFKKYLKKDYKVVPIKEVNSGSIALCDTLLIVKENSDE